MEESKKRIKEYLIQINEENKIKDFDIEELIERVLIYINRKELPKELERALARHLIQREKDELMLASSSVGEVASMSDNGQSVTFKSISESKLIKDYDDYLLNGLEPLLDRYRTVKVFREDTLL